MPMYLTATEVRIQRRVCVPRALVHRMLGCGHSAFPFYILLFKEVNESIRKSNPSLIFRHN